MVDINDAIKVLTRGPIKLFASTQPPASLLAALVNIARGRLAQATVDLDRARGLIVGVP